MIKGKGLLIIKKNNNGIEEEYLRYEGEWFNGMVITNLLNFY